MGGRVANRRWTGLGLAVAAVLFGAHALPAHAVPPMQPAEIIDPNGFERPMRAITLQIPQGWRSEGQVRWQPQAACQAEATQFVFRASDPTGRAGIEVIPGTGWQANNLPMPPISGGCATLRIQTPQQYLQALVAKVRPGARILDYRDRPDLVTGPTVPMAGVPGIENRQVRAGGQVLIGYEAGGQQMREIIVAITDVTVTRMMGIGPNDIREFLIGMALPALAVRAPAGQLDFATAEAIRQSIAVDPEWQARMNRHTSAIAATNARAARDRSAIIAETARSTNETLMQGWRDRNAAMDRTQEQRIRQIREETQYANPDGSRVNLSSHYSNAWQMPNGTYIQGNGGFDPNRDLGISATPLRPLE